MYCEAAAHALQHHDDASIATISIQLLAVMAPCCSGAQLETMEGVLLQCASQLQGHMGAQGHTEQQGTTQALSLLLNGLSQAGSAVAQRIARSFAPVAMQQLAAAAGAATALCRRQLVADSPMEAADDQASTLAHIEQSAGNAEFLGLMRLASAAADVLDVAVFGTVQASSRALCDSALLQVAGVADDNPVSFDGAVAAPLLPQAVVALAELTDVLSYGSAWRSAEGGKTLLQTWQSLCTLAAGSMAALAPGDISGLLPAVAQCVQAVWGQVRLDDEVVVSERAAPAAQLVAAAHCLRLRMPGSEPTIPMVPTLSSVCGVLGAVRSAVREGDPPPSHKGALQALQGDLATLAGAVHACALRHSAVAIDDVSGAAEDEQAMAATLRGDAAAAVTAFWEAAWTTHKSRALVKMQVWACCVCIRGISVSSSTSDVLLAGAVQGARVLSHAARKLGGMSKSAQRALLGDLALATHCIAGMSGGCAALDGPVLVGLLAALLGHGRTLLSGRVWGAVLERGVGKTADDCDTALAVASVGVVADSVADSEPALTADQAAAWAVAAAAAEQAVGGGWDTDADGPVPSILSCLAKVAGAINADSPSGGMVRLVAALHLGSVAVEASAALAEASRELEEGVEGGCEAEAELQELHPLVVASVKGLLHLVRSTPAGATAHGVAVRALRDADASLKADLQSMLGEGEWGALQDTLGALTQK